MWYKKDMKYIYVDGGCRNNQDPAKRQAYGSFLIGSKEYPNHLENKPVIQRIEYGNMTNNQAEYMILLDALQYCIENHIQAPHIFSDSALVINQMDGTFKANRPELQILRNTAIGLKYQASATIEWVSRDIIEGVLGH